MSQDVVKEVLYYERVSPLFLAGVLAMAFVLGAMHALGPGHGKSLMAAYLVGTKGRSRDAVALALSLSLAHVLVVVVVALVALWLMDFFWAESATRWFALASGLAISAIGMWLLVTRVRALRGAVVEDSAPTSGECHVHHDHLGWRGSMFKGHSHQDHADVLSMATREKRSWLYAAGLGMSSGLVPCPKALVILLLAISMHKIVLGLAIVASFSLGIASVLVALGLAMAKARGLVEHRLQARGAAYLAVAGAIVITALGALITFRSLTGA